MIFLFQWWQPLKLLQELRKHLLCFNSWRNCRHTILMFSQSHCNINNNNNNHPPPKKNYILPLNIFGAGCSFSRIHYIFPARVQLFSNPVYLVHRIAISNPFFFVRLILSSQPDIWVKQWVWRTCIWSFGPLWLGLCGYTQAAVAPGSYRLRQEVYALQVDIWT